MMMKKRPEDALRDLLEHLVLEDRGDDRFVGESQTAANGRIFGGLVFAQAMRAAQATAPEREVHSVHGSFLRAGDPKQPIEYAVVRLRDGRSFTTRRVTASQGGQIIFESTVSFHVEEPGIERQVDVTGSLEPSGEAYEDGLVRAARARGFQITRKSFGHAPIEILVEGGLTMAEGEPRPPELRSWLRSREPLPDDPGLHAAILAYASDLMIVLPGFHPLGFGVMREGVQTASLDHAMWFHEPVRIDDWVLAVGDGPVLKRSRVLGRMLFYDRRGRLVASAVQEGLARIPD